ncbi:hypothetical protein LTR91_009165 [Friedmanniomyces endolithicus]|uniref:Uncharacterized protein n=1 Tax=Friedmanniomyces endolithicus TaxID=329885 RepID=A0AAN6KLZ7_9PEZI|nr:hypothetical protein LTR94_012927 [Friedmanniomyces endolithicus]KAK0782926.1 hypothetical protein LTR59_011988 [Friedmanniomyces endolithicus]KAK0802661.1 hypothetical protein LTR75_008232 [Friedmanniomyces endolithicus]KAK0803335.1 hypothetical protein LTR38_006195 [Friedmanniomyces endolithicus]KAK0832588.1 hypothetical protein LTR03_015102 [Friedmanniomyces endolithicus]
MPFCAPRTSCSRLLADDSPVRPCRQPRYTLSRLPSLDGEPSDGQTEKHVSADRSVSGNSSTRTVIRKQPDTGPEVVTASQSQLCVDAERRISSMQKLRRRVQLTKGTKSVSETQPKVEFGQTNTAPASLRRKGDILDMRSEYERSSSGDSSDDPTDYSLPPGMEDDDEWVTDDESDDELGPR